MLQSCAKIDSIHSSPQNSTKQFKSIKNNKLKYNMYILSLCHDTLN